MEKVKFLEFTVEKGNVLYIPPYWWYSIQFTDNTVVYAITYNSDGKQCLFGCDGGVFYTADVTNDAWNSNQAIVQRNNEYYVTQFYAGSLSQTKGSNIMLAGAQDNGTQYFSKPGINDDFLVAGGDGGYCFISPTDDKTQVVSYVYNQFYATTNSWTSFKQILNDNKDIYDNHVTPQYLYLLDNTNKYNY
jgi:hypothetical protein